MSHSPFRPVDLAIANKQIASRTFGNLTTAILPPQDIRVARRSPTRPDEFSDQAGRLAVKVFTPRGSTAPVPQSFVSRGWNPSDVNAAVAGTFSNGHYLTVASGPTGAFAGRGLTSHSSGNWYLEFFANSLGGGSGQAVGVHGSTALALTYSPGADDATVSLYANLVWVAGNFLSGFGGTAAGDIMGFRCSFGQYIGVDKNGILNRQGAMNVAPLYPFFQGANGGTAEVCTIRTLASEMSYLPDGFQAWDEAAFVPPAGNGLHDADFASVDLLIHTNNTAGCDPFYDHSSAHHLVNPVGRVTRSTAQYQWSPSSIRVDVGKYLQCPITSVNLGTLSLWTVECWFRPDAAGNFIPLCFGVAGDDLYIEWFSGGWYVGDSSINNISGVAGTPTAAAWNHIALTKNGSQYRLFLNGVQVGASTTVLKSFTYTDLQIGARSGATSWSAGYIDDVRFTPGVSRYNSGFSVPTAEFGDSV